MSDFFLSITAGLLSIFAPCSLFVVPIVLSQNFTKSKLSQRVRLSLIFGSMATSIIVFSLLLRSTTAFIGAPESILVKSSGVLIAFYGLTYLIPNFWNKISHKLGYERRANKALGKSLQLKNEKLSAILIGASIGPIFNSCSPTYALILAVVIPKSFSLGLLYLIVYVMSFISVILLVAVLGQKITSKITKLYSSKLFKLIIGSVLIIIGLSIVFGYDKDIQTFFVERGWYVNH